MATVKTPGSVVAARSDGRFQYSCQRGQTTLKPLLKLQQIVRGSKQVPGASHAAAERRNCTARNYDVRHIAVESGVLVVCASRLCRLFCVLVMTKDYPFNTVSSMKLSIRQFEEQSNTNEARKNTPIRICRKNINTLISLERKCTHHSLSPKNITGTHIPGSNISQMLPA